MGSGYYFHVANTWDNHLNITTWAIGQSNSTEVVNTIATIDWAPKIPGLFNVGAGKWYVEGGVYHLFIPGSITDSDHPSVYETHALVSAGGATCTTPACPFTFWSDPVSITVDSANIYDPAVWKIGSTYYMWFTFGTASTDHWIYLASASTLLGPYTTIKSGDWAGWGNRKEGPTMYSTGPTSWRLAVEDINSCFVSSCGLNPMKYSDCNTLDITACTWTSLQPWVEPFNFRHGSVLGPNY